MEQVVAEPTAVAAMYRKAREADEDARSAAIRVNSRITLAYQALHQYATAALEAAGLRAKHAPVFSSPADPLEPCSRYLLDAWLRRAYEKAKLAKCFNGRSGMAAAVLLLGLAWFLP